MIAIRILIKWWNEWYWTRASANNNKKQQKGKSVILIVIFITNESGAVFPLGQMTSQLQYQWSQYRPAGELSFFTNWKVFYFFPRVWFILVKLALNVAKFRRPRIKPHQSFVKICQAAINGWRNNCDAHACYLVWCKARSVGCKWFVSYDYHVLVVDESLICYNFNGGFEFLMRKLFC